MCQYCNPKMSFGNESIIHNEQVNVFIGNDVFHVLVQGENISNKKLIKFCPMCGREFKESK